MLTDSMFSQEFLIYILFAISILLTFSGIRNSLPYVFSRNWVKVDGQTLSIVERKKKVWLSVFGAINYYYPEIKYKYQYSGAEYESDKVGFNIKDYWVPEVDAWGDTVREDKKFWDGWTKDKVISIYVNPKKPRYAVIVKSPAKEVRSHLFSMIVIGLIFLVVAILLF